MCKKYCNVIVMLYQLQVVQTILPYHRVMTPKWIHNNAVITGPHTLYPQYLEILPTTGDLYQRALQVQLVAPNILSSNDSVTITLTAAVDTTIPDSADHDIILGVSDGMSFIGFHIHDKSNYNHLSPCIKFEGDIVNGALKNKVQGSGSLVISRKFSSKIAMQIKPSEQWGSCHTEHDGGYVNVQNYQPSLNLSKSLYFEFYRDHATEKYRIKYIVVDVDLD